MDKAPTQFDWIGWLATIPGIPAGWGAPPADPAPATAADATGALPPPTAARVAPGLPERLAA